MNVFLDNFTDWNSVLEEFAVDIKEPKYIFAGYNVEGYDGSALLVYSYDGIIFTVVEASHCSCYGLSECWSPTEHSYEQLIKMKDITYDYEKPYQEWLAKFDMVI